jgi:hypothetical protein
MLLLDPVLLVAGAMAMWRVRSRIILAWIGVVLASVLAWQYRNAAYLAPLAPALAVGGAMAVTKNLRRIALASAAVLLIAKVCLPGEPFGIPFRPEVANPSLAQLDEYASKHRSNDLIIVEPDDQFYSADLDLPRVRYLWLDPSANRPPLPLDFEFLGITVSAAEFAKLPHLLPVYQQRLRQWNLDSTAPVATAILARRPEEIRDLIASHPEADFFVPAELSSPVHERWQAGSRVFLLSR